jgi:ribosomal subunit interface protein
MQIQVNGKQIDIGDSLRSHVETRLEEAVVKYAERPVDAHVNFSREGSFFKADAQVHLSTGLVSQAAATDAEIYAAFEKAVERIEKQLRRYKRRLKDHHAARRGAVDTVPAAYAVISGEEGPEEPESLDPVIVAEMQTAIHTVSVGEAVMRMELAHAPFLMFRNERHGGLNVVYRRDDGNIGWIDPENMPAEAS